MGTLVGRGLELSMLDRALDGLARGEGGLLQVVGEPGIGKTRLLAELGSRAEQRGHIVLEGQASEFERDLPFGLLVDGLDPYLQSIRDHELSTLGSDRLRELGRIFPALAHFGSEQTPPLQAERFRFHSAVGRLLQLLATGRGLVLLLDDVHWCDAATSELFSYLVRRRPSGGVLLTLAFRPSETPPHLLAVLATGAKEGGVERIELGPLSAAESDELLGSAIAPGARAGVYDQCGGNPFFLEQLARAAPGAGGDERGGPPSTEAVVPPAVTAAIEEELKRLPDRARVLLEAAAVAGEDFDPDLAARVGDLDPTESLGLLDELLEHDIVRPTKFPREFRFRHPIVRRAVYESAGAGWKIAAHARAAAALVAHGAPPIACAHHVERSARPGDPKAIALLVSAGESAAPRAPATAAHWFAAALRLMPKGAAAPPERLELLFRLSKSLVASGRLDESDAALAEAENLLPPESTAERVRLVAARAGVELLLGRHDEALGRLGAALSGLEDRRSAASVALELELASNRIWLADWAGALAMARVARVSAQALGEPALAATAAGLCAGCQIGLGHTAEALAYADEAAALVDALDDAQLAMRLDAMVYLGLAEYFLDRFDLAIGRLARAVAVSRATGQEHLYVSLITGQAWALAARGRLKEAAEVSDGGVESSELSGNARNLCLALFARCWVAVVAGDLETARDTGERALAAAAALEEGVLPSAAAWPLAAALIETGEPDRCEELVIGEVAEGRLFASVRCHCYELLTRVELSRGRVTKARGCADRGWALAEETGVDLGAVYAHRARARVLLAEGDAAAAAAESLRAAELAGGLGARIEAGRSRALAGEALAAAGDRERAIAELDSAAKELGECGARGFRDHAVRTLRRLGRRVPALRTEAGLGSLTRREQQIAELLSKGKTNRQLAEELFLSEKTVETHLSHIFTKLGVSSRTAAAAELQRLVRDLP